MDPNLFTAIAWLMSYGAESASIARAHGWYLAGTGLFVLVGAACMVLAIHRFLIIRRTGWSSDALFDGRMASMQLCIYLTAVFCGIVLSRDLDYGKVDRDLLEAKAEFSCATIRLAAADGRLTAIPGLLKSEMRDRCGPIVIETASNEAGILVIDKQN